MTQRTAAVAITSRAQHAVAHHLEHRSLQNAFLSFLPGLLALLTAPPGACEHPRVHCLTLLDSATANLGILYFPAIEVHDGTHRQAWLPNVPSCPKSCGHSFRHAGPITLACPKKRGDNLRHANPIVLGGVVAILDPTSPFLAVDFKHVLGAIINVVTCHYSVWFDPFELVVSSYSHFLFADFWRYPYLLSIANISYASSVSVLSFMLSLSFIACLC